MEGDERDERCVLVTGVAGFVGSHFARKLLSDPKVVKVVGVDKLGITSSMNNLADLNRHDRFLFVRGDILSEGFVGLLCEVHRVNVFVHFAAQTLCDEDATNSPSFTLNNVLGTHVILESLRMYGKVDRYIYISTDEVHGKKIKMSDSQEPSQLLFEPPNPYSAAKVSAEMMSNVYSLAYGLPVIIVRLTNVYGPCEYPYRAIPKFIMLALKGVDLPIHGDGSAVRSFIYIDDVVDGLHIILSKGKINETYGLGPKTQQRIIDVANDIIREVGDHGNAPKLLTIHGRSFVEERFFIVDEKLRSLGWSETFSWPEGLRKTIEWYKKHGDTWWDSHAPVKVPSPLLPLSASISRGAAYN